MKEGKERSNRPWESLHYYTILGRKRNSLFCTHTHTHTQHIECLNVNFLIINCNVPMRKFLFWATSKYLVKGFFLLLKGKYQKATSLGGPWPPYISLALERIQWNNRREMPASEGINVESSTSTAWLSPQYIGQISLKSLPGKTQTPG